MGYLVIDGILMIYGGFLKWGYPEMVGLFIRENAMNIRMIWG